MHDPIVILLAVIAVLLFAILLAVCPPCRKFFSEAMGCLVAAAIFLVPIGAVVWLGVWLVRTYGFYEVSLNVLVVAMIFGIPAAVFGLIIWIDGHFMDKRLAARWKKQRAQENADNEKDKPTD